MKKVKKVVADAPSEPQIDRLIAHYREAITYYREQKSCLKLVADRATWLLAGDFSSQPPEGKESMISELELAVDYAEQALITLNCLHVSEIGPHEIGQLLDASDMLAMRMHELGRIACKIGIEEVKKEKTRDAAWRGREELKGFVVKIAQRESVYHENRWQLSGALVDRTINEAQRLDDEKFLRVGDKQKLIYGWLSGSPLKFSK